ncbi:type II secretion system protein J [Desulfococcus sp.]|uniref:PulJ/GspJ family protein n=1 Tax=Desulfococcus sp. TaxID=2025834 RepID=UPI003594298F
MRQNGSRPKTAPEKPHGFTLLELIISLTILGVIVTIVFGALRIGVRAWEKGESDIDNRQRHRIVLDRIGQQMASIYIPVDLPMAEAAKYHLRGDAFSVEFISRTSLMPENRAGLVYVKYEVRTDGDGGRSLLFYEQNLAQRSPDPQENEIREEDFHVLLPHAAECGFAYLRVASPEVQGKLPNMKPDPKTDFKKHIGRMDAGPMDGGWTGGKEYSWETAWDPEVEKHNPRAVALSLRGAGESRPVRIIAPVPGGDRP